MLDAAALHNALGRQRCRPPHAEYRLTRRGERLALAVAGLLEHR